MHDKVLRVEQSAPFHPVVQLQKPGLEQIPPLRHPWWQMAKMIIHTHCKVQLHV